MKKFLSLVLALVMTMSLVTVSAGAKDFKDADKISYVEAVEVMQTVGVIDGFEDGSFKPAEGLTRAQAAKIISNMILGPATADAMKATAAPFKDVPASHWAAGYIAYCASEGIINGVGDGKFNPNGALTGFAFMKMLLGALGYDAEVEGYVGANWAVNVAKRAIQLGLDDGLVSGLNGAKPATREEACLYALNTLKTPMVEYENTSSVTIGDVVIKNSSKAKEIGSNANTIAAGGKLEFAEKYFKKLSLKADQEDSMGRICNEWTFEGKTESYAKAADYTHMGDTKIYKIYDALGLKDKVAKTDIQIWEDGKELTGTKAHPKYDLTNKGEFKDKKYGNDAAELSLYIVEKTDGSIDHINMVIVNTYIGKVAAVGTNKDGERYVKVAGLEFVTDKFAKDDWVLYTKDEKNEDNEAELLTLTLAEKMTGKLTLMTDEKFVIDGTTYEVAPKAQIGGERPVDVKDTVDFYLADGLIIKMDEAEDSVNISNIAIVTAVIEADDRYDDAATLVTSEGKELKKVTLAKNYVSDTPDNWNDGDALEIGNVVLYSVEDDGSYKLTVKGGVEDADTVQAGKAMVYDGDDPVFSVDNETVFVYMITKDDKIDSYKVVTGYKNSLTAEGAEIAMYRKDNKSAAAVVFVKVDNEDLNNDSSDATVIAYDDVKITYDGDNLYYVYNAVVDGKVTTVKVDDDLFGDIAAADGTFVISKNVKTDKDGIINDLGDMLGEPAEATVKVSNGVIKIGNVALTTAKDVTVITVDDGDIAVITLDEIEEDDNHDLDPYDFVSYTLNDKGEVDYIVLQLDQD